KQYTCMWCGGVIEVGEQYCRDTCLFDGQFYDWVSHNECSKITGLLNMRDEGYGINDEDFRNEILNYAYEHHYDSEKEEFDEGWGDDQDIYILVKKITEELKYE
ncbi:MAG: hypothetical protein IKU29_04935, partial [Parabacteroides sp.]|nr:hypothetical protein [Parabacteroides sp.]